MTATAEDAESDKYGVQKTIDGKLDTAWHSGGHRIPTNVGVEVRFVFNRPVKLARVNVINGFTRSPNDFTNNHRVKKMRCAPRPAERAWSMADKVDAAERWTSTAPRRKVTFIIEETYPGTNFKDVCITEVTFDELV